MSLFSTQSLDAEREKDRSRRDEWWRQDDSREAHRWDSPASVWDSVGIWKWYEYDRSLDLLPAYWLPHSGARDIRWDDPRESHRIESGMSRDLPRVSTRGSRPRSVRIYRWYASLSRDRNRRKRSETLGWTATATRHRKDISRQSRDHPSRWTHLGSRLREWRTHHSSPRKTLSE